MREFFRHGAIVAAGMIAANALIYVFYALVTRAVGVDRAGEFTAIISATVLLSLPANIGGNIATKIVADAAGRGHAGTARVIMGYIDRWWLGFVAATVLVGWYGLGWIGSFFHVDDRFALALGLAGFALTFPLQPQRSVIQGAGAFVPYVLSQLIEGSTKALAGIGLYVFGGGLRGALLGYALGAGAAFCYNVAWGGAQRGEAEKGGGNLTLVASVIGIALPIGAITMVTFTDVIVVQHVFPPYVAGLYGASALVGRAIATVVGFVYVVLLPKAASRTAAGSSSTRLLFAALIAAAAILATALLATGLFPVQVVTMLAGRSFRDAGPFVFPYAIAMSELGLATILASYLIALGRIWFGAPLTCLAFMEILALLLYHPTVWVVLTIVIAGHGAMLACCAVGVLLSRTGARPRSVEETVQGSGSEPNVLEQP